MSEKPKLSEILILLAAGALFLVGSAL